MSYKVKYYLKDVMGRENSILEGPDYFEFDTISFGSAIDTALDKFEEIFFTSRHDIWNATIETPEGKKVELLKEGRWLFDTETKKSLSNLEEKISNKKQ